MFSAKFGQRKTPAAKTYASLQAGLVGYWPMNEASGNALNQTSGSHLTAVNSPGAVTGQINGGRSFTRASSQRFYAAASDNLVLLGPTNYTASFWFYPSGNWTYDGSKQYGLLSNDAYPTQRGNCLVIYGTAAPSGSNWPLPYLSLAFTDGTTSNYDPFSAGTIAKDTWHFFCMRRDGNTIKFRYNATNGNNYTLSKTFFSSRSWFHVGAFYGSNASATDHFNGYIDELAIWNRTLSDSEVTSLYNSGNGIDLRL